MAEFTIYRAAKVLGISPSEAGWLDAAEINRALCFKAAEDNAQARANYTP